MWYFIIGLIIAVLTAMWLRVYEEKNKVWPYRGDYAILVWCAAGITVFGLCVIALLLYIKG